MSERWATFDCYGTLIDWERGIADALTGLWPDREASHLLARYHEFEPQVQRGSGVAYREVLAATLTHIAQAEELELGADQRDTLSEALPEWPPFPEVPTELAAVRENGWKIAILSNTDPDLLDSSIRRIGVDADLAITVAQAGSYKPAHGHWNRFFEDTGADSAAHIHVAASLFHDIAPAAELGLRTVWINRKAETTDLPIAAELPTLEGLAATLNEIVGSE